MPPLSPPPSPPLQSPTHTYLNVSLEILGDSLRIYSGFQQRWSFCCQDAQDSSGRDAPAEILASLPAGGGGKESRSEESQRRCGQQYANSSRAVL